MKYLLLTIFITFIYSAYSQNITQLIGGPQIEKGEIVFECANNDILLGGITNSYGAGQEDIIITRLTPTGQIIWSRTYGLQDDENGSSIALHEASNGDILLAFRSYSVLNMRSGIVMRLNSTGGIIWQKRIGQPTGTLEGARGITEDNNGDIYLGIGLNSSTFGSSDGMIVKLDANGTIIWSKTLGASNNDHVWSYITLPNDDVLLNVNSQDLGPGGRDPVFVKVSANGNTLSQVAFGGPQLDIMNKFIHIPSVGYIGVGGTESYGQGGRDAFIVKFDLNFNLQWFKTYGGPYYDNGVMIERVDNNHFVMYMQSDFANSNDKRMSIVGVDAVGNTLYSKTLGNQFKQTISSYNSNGLIYSQGQNKTFLTNQFFTSTNTSDMLFMAFEGTPDLMCLDTVLTESTHSPSVMNVSFNEENNVTSSNVNLSTSLVNNLNVTPTCLCPFDYQNIADTSICPNTTIQFDLDTNYNYDWSPAGDFSCTNCPNPTFIGDSTTQVEVIIDNIFCYDTLNFTITVEDSFFPSGTAPNDTTIQCIDELPTPDINLVSNIWDNCTSNPIVTFVSDVSDNNFCPETITRTYNITDGNGNDTDVIQLIIVMDTIPPTGSAPPDTTVQCVNNIPPADIAAITDATDNCTNTPIITHISDVSDSNTCPEIITRTYNIADSCGNNIDVVQTLTINDTITPTATAPNDTTVQCIDEIPPADITTISDAIDNCIAAPIVTHVSDVSDNNSCPEIITRTYNIADSCGNAIDVIQTLTIMDTITPTATAPADTFVQCANDLPLPAIAAITDAADNCTTNPIITHVSDISDGNSCPEIITRTYNIADNCSNNIDVVQTLTIHDTISPTASNPSPIDVQCIGNVPAPNISEITDATDNCTANPIVAHVGDISNGNSCPEIITRTYSITDDCGNSSNVTQTITVNDTIAPTAIAPPDSTVQCIGEIPLPDITLITDVNDNCTVNPTVSFVSDVSDNNTCPEIITRTYNIADNCGNNTDVTQVFTVHDDILPTASNINTTVQCLSDVPPVDIVVVSDAADNCTNNPIVAFVSETTDGNTCNGEIITRTYSVTDNCGNSINVNHTILVDSYTPTFSVSGQGTNSCDGSDGTITLSGLAPNTDYEMSYDGSSTITITTNAAGEYIITGLSAGSYTNYTVSDADCPSCSTTENVSININDPTAAVIGAGPDHEYCEGTTVVLNAYNPEGANISWNNGVTDGVGFVPPVGVSYYTVTSERVNCFSSDQIMITVSPAITDITCPEDLTASCALSEQPTYANFDEFIAAGGSASIPTGGVIDSTSFTLLSEVTDSIACPETITRTYQIADTCGVTVSCTQEIVISETIPPTGTAPADTTLQCIDDVPVANINSITDAADNCSNTPTITHSGDVSDGNTCPGIITRTYNIEDKCGNNIDVTQIITINDTIAPTASHPDTLTVDCLANVPPKNSNVVTDEADNCTNNPTVTFVSETSNGNTCNGEEITRIYNVEDDCGNSIDVTQIIIVDVFNPIFTVSSTDPTTCSGNDGTITLSGLNPSTDYELIYDGGTPILITTNAAGEYIITGLSASTYTDFTITEANCMECSTTENISITLTDPLPPTVDAGSDLEICKNDTVILFASNPDAANISWDNGITDSLEFTPPVGTTTYTVTAEKFNCFSTDNVSVTVHPLPNVSAGTDQTVCEGEQVTLTGSGAATYAWDNGITDGLAFTPSLGTTTYTVVGTSIHGCITSDDVVVEAVVSPEVSFSASQTTGCAPETINLYNTSTGGTPTTCIFTINGQQQAPGCNINPTFTEAGCYDINLEVEISNGCFDDLTLNDYICIDDYPVAKFSVDPEELTNVHHIADFTNESVGANAYEWNFGDGQFSNITHPIHEYDVNSIDKVFLFDVVLIATSDLGCQDTFSLGLPFYEEVVYYIPNTFTPDGSNLNDVFKPVFTSGFDPHQYQLTIYNRWGELIFESNNHEYGWDGTYGVGEHRPVPDGTYVWKINYTQLKNDENVEITGSVNLLR